MVDIFIDHTWPNDDVKIFDHNQWNRRNQIVHGHERANKSISFSRIKIIKVKRNHSSIYIKEENKMHIESSLAKTKTYNNRAHKFVLAINGNCLEKPNRIKRRKKEENRIKATMTTQQRVMKKNDKILKSVKIPKTTYNQITTTTTTKCLQMNMNTHTHISYIDTFKSYTHEILLNTKLYKEDQESKWKTR